MARWKTGEVITGVWWGDLIDRDHWEDLGVYERKILTLNVQEVGWGMDWMDMAQDRNRWRDLVKAVMNLRVPRNAGRFFTG
jgi:hypothetical protein